MNNQMKLSWRLLKGLATHPLLLSIVCVVSIVQVLCMLYVPVLVGAVIDVITESQESLLRNQLLLALLGQLLLFIVVSGLLQWVSGVCCNQLVYRFTQTLRMQAVMQLQQAPMSIVDQFSLGDLVSRLTTDVEQLTDGLLLLFTQLISGVLTIIVTIGMMATMDGWMLLLVLGLTPMSLFIAQFIAKKSYHLFQLQAQTRGVQSEYVEESIRQLTVLQQMQVIPTIEERFNHTNEQYAQAALQATFYASTVNPLTRFVNAIIYAALTGVGALRVVQSAFSIGELVTFLSYAMQYTKPFNDISGVLTELQGALVCAQRLYALCDVPIEVETGHDKIAAEHVQGIVSFNDVSFSYTPDQSLIERFNMTARKGQKIAIVGPTGAGKSTIINLLMRFYEAQKGTIRLDQTSISTYARANWRDTIGMVPQETWLFSGTVHENIAYGFPKATRQAVMEAASLANAAFFIEQLPQGYDTRLEDAGASLSQGQRQLIAIARIFLNPPNLLILDEATSSVDAYTEKLIQDAFDQLMAGRTSFIIAHRLATIQSADLIIVMDQGRVVEQGTHAELLALKGIYYRMQENIQQ